MTRYPLSEPIPADSPVALLLEKRLIDLHRDPSGVHAVTLADTGFVFAKLIDIKNVLTPGQTVSIMGLCFRHLQDEAAGPWTINGPLLESHVLWRLSALGLFDLEDTDGSGTLYRVAPTDLGMTIGRIQMAQEGEPGDD